MSLLKDHLAKALAEHLAEATGFAFFPQRHDGETAPPFGVVVVPRLKPVGTGDDTHYADVRIVVVSDIADGPSILQSQRVGAAWTAIHGIPKPSRDVVNKVVLHGFLVEDIEQASGTGNDGQKVFSDVFIVKAGASAMP